MARLIFATQPVTGHILPALPIVRALVARGHEVAWYTGIKFRRQVQEIGAQFAPFTDAYDYDDADYDVAFPGRSRLRGINQIRFDFINLFMKQIAPQYRDLTALLKRFPADALVGDPSVFAAFGVNERGGPPNAVYNISCLGIPGREVAPFGLGLPPAGSPLGVLRNRALGFLSSRVIFGAVSAELARQCRLVGTRPRPFTGVAVSPYLFIQSLVPGFEYPRSDLPPQVHFVGAVLPEPPASFTPPAWWEEATTRRRPVVLVTQGTVATDARELVAPTIRALAGEDVLVIAAGVRDQAALGLEALPANVRIAPFVPFTLLMPYVDVYVTNGGLGGVQTALANGVPIIAGGSTEDKPEIANRIVYSGVGINLRTATPAPAQVRAAVMEVLRDERYRTGARRLQAEIARYGGATQAAQLIEQLAATQAPVLRQQPVLREGVTNTQGI